MAKKETFNDTEELRAAIADLQAKIEARDHRRREESESEIVQDSWIHKEETADAETEEPAVEISGEDEEPMENPDADAEIEEPADEETAPEQTLSDRKKRIIRETTGKQRKRFGNIMNIRVMKDPVTRPVHIMAERRKEMMMISLFP